MSNVETQPPQQGQVLYDVGCSQGENDNAGKGTNIKVEVQLDHLPQCPQQRHIPAKGHPFRGSELMPPYVRRYGGLTVHPSHSDLMCICMKQY